MADTAPYRTIRVDGAVVAVSESGSGRPLLLNMGLGGHMQMWRPLVRLLNPCGIRTIAYDSPGLGLSTPYKRPRRLPGMARTVMSLLDELGYEQVDVLGVSWGGGIAQQLAHQFPDRFRRLVLCATSPGMISLPGYPRSASAIARALSCKGSSHYERLAPVLFGGRSARDPARLRRAGERFEFPRSPLGYLNQLYAGAGWTSFHWLPNLHQPTLVMAGDDDPIVPLLNARLLTARIPDSRMHVVRGGGHLFLAEQAEESAQVICSFLAD